ncbi:MAG TPA: UDP-N-acetylglucosamine-peptide N-acetylglucosaminyltransferase, partial [Gammaproteobacteria bacterium]|nr:UDP-N-acetylglucosamine-peptide N-acetylglucosaminyltransferase [Gammaproteobacteria bacterium]
SSLLSNVGLEHLVAHSAEDYVEIAASLISDTETLVSLRGELRTMLQSSPVMDSPRFTRDLEAAFREMWRNWCAGR